MISYWYELSVLGYFTVLLLSYFNCLKSGCSFWKCPPPLKIYKREGWKGRVPLFEKGRKKMSYFVIFIFSNVYKRENNLLTRYMPFYNLSMCKSEKNPLPFKLHIVHKQLFNRWTGQVLQRCWQTRVLLIYLIKCEYILVFKTQL